MEDINFKELDRQSITAYLKDKKSTPVSDIIANSGANKLRVYAILFEMEQEGRIVVTEKELLGAPKSVKMN